MVYGTTLKCNEKMLSIESYWIWIDVTFAQARVPHLKAFDVFLHRSFLGIELHFWIWQSSCSDISDSEKAFCIFLCSSMLWHFLKASKHSFTSDNECIPVLLLWTLNYATSRCFRKRILPWTLRTECHILAITRGFKISWLAYSTISCSC